MILYWAACFFLWLETWSPTVDLRRYPPKCSAAGPVTPDIHDAACHGGPELCPGSAVEANWSFSLDFSARVSLYSLLRWSHESNVTHWFLAECRVNDHTVRCRVSQPQPHEGWKYFSIYLRVIGMSKHAHTHTTAVQYIQRKLRIEPLLCCCACSTSQYSSNSHGPLFCRLFLWQAIVTPTVEKCNYKNNSNLSYYVLIFYSFLFEVKT